MSDVAYRLAEIYGAEDGESQVRNLIGDRPEALRMVEFLFFVNNKATLKQNLIKEGQIDLARSLDEDISHALDLHYDAMKKTFSDRFFVELAGKLKKRKASDMIENEMEDIENEFWDKYGPDKSELIQFNIYSQVEVLKEGFPGIAFDLCIFCGKSPDDCKCVCYHCEKTREGCECEDFLIASNLYEALETMRQENDNQNSAWTLAISKAVSSEFKKKIGPILKNTDKLWFCAICYKKSDKKYRFCRACNPKKKK